MRRWEIIGREAARLGFDLHQRGIKTWRIRGGGGGPNGWSDKIPDFRDRLTCLACIAWAEDVARGVYGEDLVGLRWGWSDDDPRCDDEHRVLWATIEGGYSVTRGKTGDTLHQAAIAAVRAMKDEVSERV